MPLIIFLIFNFLLIPLILIFWIYRKRSDKSKVDFNPDYKFLNLSDLKNEESNYSNIEKNIDSLYFVHGTFLGDDPWQILALLKAIVPQGSTSILDKIKISIKTSQELFIKDRANFTGKHIAETSRLLNENVKVNLFRWSSGNNHLARVIGAIDLLKTIASDNDRNIVLVGHSHAGQLFAIITKLINNKKFKNDLFSVLNYSAQEREFLNFEIKKIENKIFHFYTLGTPIRYSFELSPIKHNLTNIINHRGKEPIGGRISGIIFTSSGDYIQQYGIEGSDFVSPVKTENLLNNKLDNILDEGRNLNLLRKNILLRRRLSDQGENLLIDYKDSSKIPNFISTVLGHGVYTKLNHLDIILKIINKRV